MSNLDEIKSRLDIVAYINRFVPLKKMGRYYKAPCPFHSEKTPSFVVYEDRQSWRCYGACSEGGDIFGFAMKMNGWNFKEALEELGKLAGVPVIPHSSESIQREKHLEKLRALMKEAAKAYHLALFDDTVPGAQLAREYATVGRGFSLDVLEQFEIGYAPKGWTALIDVLTKIGYSATDLIEVGLAVKHEETGRVYDRFRNRLVVPIRDPKGNVIAFGGRVLDPNDQPKYLNSPQTPLFDKNRVLFGLDLATQSIRQSETAVIVEGYMDAITAHQYGFHNVVAQMGTAFTERQLQLIAPRWAKRIVLALDSDHAGQKATVRSLEVARAALQADLSGKLKVELRVLQLEGAKDPDDLIRAEPQKWAHLVEHALTVADFLIETEVSQLPSTPSLSDRQAVAQRVMPLLLATENNMLQRENVQQLAMRLRLSEKDLLRLASDTTQAQAKIRQAKPPEHAPRNEVGINDLLAEASTPVDEEALSASFALPATPTRPTHITAEMRIEAHFLHHLFKVHEQDGNLYFQINRRFRELANGDSALIADALGVLSHKDFSYIGFQRLMTLFIEGINQEDETVFAYIESHLDELLMLDYQLVSINQLEKKLTNSAKISPLDLGQVLEQVHRNGATTSPQADVVSQAIALRKRRLNREKQELHQLHQAAQRNEDEETILRITKQIDYYARALNLLYREEASQK